MLLSHFVAALFVALLVVLVFALIGQRGPFGEIGWFFALVFLSAWAFGAWAAPVGPFLWGVAWIPFLFGALLVAFLLAALSTPPRVPPARGATAEESPDTGPAAAVAVGVFFWLTILLLVIAILFASP